MSEECGPWRSCDYHQYRSWLRRAESAVAPSSPTPDLPRKPKKQARRRPVPNDFQMLFQHHDDVSQYERDYLQQVTHARCRLANPNATVFAPPPAEPDQPKTDTNQTNSRTTSPTVRKVPIEISTSPPPAEPRKSASNILPTAESTPDLASNTGSSPRPPPAPHPASTPDLCQLLPIEIIRTSSPQPASPGVVAAESNSTISTSISQTLSSYGGAGRRTVLNTSMLRLYESGERPALASRPVLPAAAGRGTHSSVRSPLRRPAPAWERPGAGSMATLDLPTAPPPRLGATAPARHGWSRQPRGLTKIRFATPVPENLTIIVGRKLEISLSGAKKGGRGRGTR